MKGEEKHPKWILFTKSSDNFPIPFTTEIKENVFLLNFEHDVLKFNIEDGEPVNPRSAISELSWLKVWKIIGSLVSMIC